MIKRFFATLITLLAWISVSLAVIGVAGAGFAIYAMNKIGEDLPDYEHLADYTPPNVTRIHAGDGRLLAEYAREKRVFVPIDAIPTTLKHAFIAAEDQRFYSHIGIDPLGIVRAGIAYAQNYGTGRRPQGASTITQQVAKNFLLTNEVSIERKAKEAILAMRMERAFTKDQILELYLNEIFLGLRSYGVAAAALNYFDKALEELTIAESAFLAGLPKAPSRYDPRTRYDEAIERRNYVIARMLADGYISEEEAQTAYDEAIELDGRRETVFANAQFFTEEVRRELVETFGEEGFYEGGLSVRTTVDPSLQALADQALRDGLSSYDRRQGWAGPYEKIDLNATEWLAYLQDFDPGFELNDWQKGVVLNSGRAGAEVGLADGSTVQLETRHLAWARKRLGDGNLGPEITSASEVLEPGDVVTVTFLPPDEEDPAGIWALRQRPEIEGALVAINPHNGRVVAMSGGFSFRASKFNRATQAQRQPGSAFKPFVYLAAFEAGRTPSTIVLDAPVTIDQGPGLPKWKPANYSDQFYGPSTLRLGIEKSRNLMTARLAQDIGMQRVVDVSERFGIAGNLGPNLAASLGSNEVDLLSLTAAYAMLVNGGKKIEPALVERIQDRYGNSVSRRDERECADCRQLVWAQQSPPDVEDIRETVTDPRHAFQIVHVMQGVVQRGTGVRADKLGRPLAGKTGTTNESRDAWFVGFSPDLAVGVYAGYDLPRSLGRKETGASVALPIWIDFMEGALAREPVLPFRRPDGLRFVNVDAKTGLLPSSATGTIISEAFIPGTEPDTSTPAAVVAQPVVIPAGQASADGTLAPAPAQPAASTGGGIY